MHGGIFAEDGFVATALLAELIWEDTLAQYTKSTKWTAVFMAFMLYGGGFVASTNF